MTDHPPRSFLDFEYLPEDATDPLLDFEPAPADPGPDYVDTFVPAPARARRDGWSEERQRGFVAKLRETGVVAVAAKAVGRTYQTAYKLRRRPGAAGFAEAWDRALAEARSDAMAAAVERLQTRVLVPRTYRGHFTGLVRRDDTALLIAALRASHARIPAKGET